MTSLSRGQARRIALAAQGFSRAQPSGSVTGTHLRRVIRRLGFFQIDSVNVVRRAHYLPLYSRMGPYDLEVFHRAAGRRPRAMFEYWAHVATYVDVELWPVMQHRMTSRHGMWAGMDRVARENPALVDRVHQLVAERGPVTARGIDPEPDRDRSDWGWNWSQTKHALEFLFFAGIITSARRNAAFEREYDLPERVIPPEILARPALDSDSAHRVLVEHASRALGLATEPWLRDYFRTAPGPTRKAVAELAADGVLEQVTVAGRSARPLWLHRDAVTPRTVRARTLLSPFDPLVFERSRAEQLFDFRYRIEIYVPEGQREFGYYVLPFLLGDQLVARVDLKADRTRGVLLVPGAFAEPHAPADVAIELMTELRRFAGWLGLDSVQIGDRGDLATPLRRLAGGSAQTG